MPLKKQVKSNAKAQAAAPLPASPRRQKTTQGGLPSKTDTSPEAIGLNRAPRERIPADIPSSYADQIMDVAYGVHTSKLVFGEETGNSVRPLRVVVIPTASLLIAATRILNNLSATGMIEETSKRFDEIVRTMHGLSQLGTIDGEEDDVPMPKRRS